MDVKRKMFIKLYYSLLDWEWSTDPNTFRVFIQLLLTANRKDHPYKGKMIRRGETMASLEYLAETTGLSIQNVRRALENLISTNTISKRKVHKVNVYTVVNYNKWQNSRYNSDNNYNNKKYSDLKYSDHNKPVRQQHINKYPTTYQQHINKYPTTYQQHINNASTSLRYCNNEENEENERVRECEKNTHARGKLNNVFITDKEYETFSRQYSFADEVIDELSAKIATGEPKYKQGHIGHLYVFANNYTAEKAPAKPSYDIERAMQQSLRLDPAKTKRE